MKIGTSWKTSIAGITMIVGGVISLFFNIKNETTNETNVTSAATAIFGGIGLLCAKDKNVTGGTTVNSTNDANIVASSSSTSVASSVPVQPTTN